MNPNKTVCTKCSRENIKWTKDHEKMSKRGIIYCYIGTCSFDFAISDEFHREMYENFKRYSGLAIDKYFNMPPRCPYKLEHTVMNQDA